MLQCGFQKFKKKLNWENNLDCGSYIFLQLQGLKLSTWHNYKNWKKLYRGVLYIKNFIIKKIKKLNRI